jgi:DNA-binding CsgD family transcriptional regulator
MATRPPDTIRDEIVRFAQVGPDRHEFARDAVGVLRRAVPFDGVAVVWFDPATGVPVDRWGENSLTASAGSRLAEMELHEAYVNKFRELAASGRRAARMSEATDGSRRHRELLRTNGFGDELRAVCIGDSGMWGAIVMRREHGAPTFASRDVDLLASLSHGFEEVQRARLERDLSADPGERDPGLLLLNDEDGVEMANAAAAAWLDGLPDQGRRLPLVVTAVADRARAIESGHTDVAAAARGRTTSGRWVLVRGSVLCNGTHARTAVTLEPARAPELAGLIADAHGLTARERHVTELVAQGLPSAAIASRLHLSTYTVQDHLKAVFEKLDVSSRGQLVAKLFVDHHQLGRTLSDPRERDAPRVRQPPQVSSPQANWAPALVGVETSALLLEDRASLAVLLESQFAFGEAPLEHVDPGFPTAARPGWVSTAAADQQHDPDDEQEPEQWPGQDPPTSRKSH